MFQGFLSFHKCPEQIFKTLRFLSLRFSADFRCSRLVSLEALSKALLFHYESDWFDFFVLVSSALFFLNFMKFQNFTFSVENWSWIKTKGLFQHSRASTFFISLCFLFKLNFFAAFLETIPYFRILRIVHLETVFDIEKDFRSTLIRSVVFGSFYTLRTISLRSCSLSFLADLEIFFAT